MLIGSSVDERDAFVARCAATRNEQPRSEVSAEATDGRGSKQSARAIYAVSSGLRSGKLEPG
jgi:hypothetical protein